MREDFHLPASSYFTSHDLHTTSFRISNIHTRTLFLFCTCGWTTYCTRHEYNESADIQFSAAISILESHFRKHFNQYMERVWKQHLKRLRSLSPQPNQENLELSAKLPLLPKSTAATLSAYQQ